MHRNTITRVETEESTAGYSVDRIKAALEAAGVIFVDENGEGPGVRLRKA